jgi:hypothetical protein
MQPLERPPVSAKPLEYLAQDSASSSDESVEVRPVRRDAEILRLQVEVKRLQAENAGLRRALAELVKID